MQILKSYQIHADSEDELKWTNIFIIRNNLLLTTIRNLLYFQPKN